MIIKDHKLCHKFMPSQGKLLAIDVGTKRLGIAVSDETRLLATPRQIINRESNLKDFAKIAQIIKEERVVAVVMGFPINMDGSLNDMSHFSQKFAESFDEFFAGNLPIFFADERLSTFEAKDIARGLVSKKRKNAKHFDDIAASIILRDFIAMLG